MNKYIKVWLVHKIWGDNAETGRTAGQGILVTSRETGTIKMGEIQLQTSAPSVTIAGQRTTSSNNEFSCWLSELTTAEEYQAIPDSYRGSQGCYMKYSGDISSPENREFVTNEQFNSVPQDDRQIAFAS